MNAQKKTLAVVMGGAFATTLALSPMAHAAVEKGGNPFAMQSLTKAYQVADAKDGKCGTGKCGANKKKMMEDKAAEGNCSADKKAAEGNCSADKKAAEGKCNAADMKAKEGNCKH